MTVSEEGKEEEQERQEAAAPLWRPCVTNIV